MATVVSLFTTEQAASELGVTEARVRQLCWEYLPRTQKHGRDWVLTEADIERLKNRRDGRKKVSV